MRAPSATALAALSLLLLQLAPLCRAQSPPTLPCGGTLIGTLTITGRTLSQADCDRVVSDLNANYKDPYAITLATPFACTCERLFPDSTDQSCNATIVGTFNPALDLFKWYHNVGIWATGQFSPSAAYGVGAWMPFINVTNPECTPNVGCKDLFPSRLQRMLGTCNAANSDTAVVTYSDTCGGKAISPASCVVPSPPPSPVPPCAGWQSEGKSQTTTGRPKCRQA